MLDRETNELFPVDSGSGTVSEQPRAARRLRRLLFTRSHLGYLPLDGSPSLQDYGRWQSTKFGCSSTCSGWRHGDD